MKIKLLVEFEVTTEEDEEECGEFTVERAKGAASVAAWDHVCLTPNGLDVTDSVKVHVDGFGMCEVRIGRDHE